MNFSMLHILGYANYFFNRNYNMIFQASVFVKY